MDAEETHVGRKRLNDADAMLRLTRRLTGTAEPTGSVTLTYDQRTRARLRATLDDGRDAGLFLERGEVLRDGDLLGGDDGVVVVVRAAPERLSTTRCHDALLLARACYHLGNRHVPLQIGPGRLRYLHDHVLDQMLAGLGLAVQVEQAPFDPEPGAYGHGQHAH
jgi:urease accessory protein